MRLILVLGAVAVASLSACNLDGRPLRLMLGQTCAQDAQCHSGHCVSGVDQSAGVCCAAGCSPDAACSDDGRTCLPDEGEGAGLPREGAGGSLRGAGEACRRSSDCESELCADGLCCDGPCDCSESGSCGLPDGVTCEVDGDCESGNCEPGVSGQSICCQSQCDGTCQRCDLDGRCDAYPATDPRCGAVSCGADTTCQSHALPDEQSCAGPGACAPCLVQNRPAGRFCGSGEQCDAEGACAFTGLGVVAAGGAHTCAIRTNGNVRCWGQNAGGELGAAFELPAVGDDETPVSVLGLDIDFERSVLQLTAGIAHTCALLAAPASQGSRPAASGAVRCWGTSFWPEPSGASLEAVMGTPDVRLNDSGFVDPKLTADVRLPGNAVQISADPSGMHTCALLEQGDVVCWGLNSEGQLGYGDGVNVGGDRSEPLPLIALPRRALAVDAGSQHTCALLEAGGVTCWGLGRGGRLGYGGEGSRFVPVDEVELGGKAVQVAAGASHTCALLDTGGVRCWGENRTGALGYGHTTNIGDDPGETPAYAAGVLLPTPDGLTTPFGGDVALGAGRALQIEAGVGGATCARFDGGAVRCWGGNASAALGYEHRVNIGDEFTPEQAAGRSTSVDGRAVRVGGDLHLGGAAIALASGARCALLLERKLRCWGDNGHGELGYGRVGMPDSGGFTPEDLGDVPYE